MGFMEIAGNIKAGADYAIVCAQNKILMQQFSGQLQNDRTITENEKGNALTHDQNVGGGEILQIEGVKQHEWKFFDKGIIDEIASITYLKVGVSILLILLAVMLILNILKVRSIFKAKGISNELENISTIKRRDAYVIRSNKFLKTITSFVQKLGFSISRDKQEYMEYNIKRADLKVPGGYRYLTPDEFNACIKTVTAALLILGLAVMLFINGSIGALIMIVTVVLSSTLPMSILRNVVADRDNEVKKNFMNFYLQLHYILLDGGHTPLAQQMRSYKKTTDSKEMHKFVDNCCGYMDTYGEYQATRKISKDYREITEVGRLMRLIRQQQDGGDIEQELLGFREQLIKEQRYMIEQRSEKLVAKARASFNLLIPILVQAVVSAMAIYLPDIAEINNII